MLVKYASHCCAVETNLILVFYVFRLERHPFFWKLYLSEKRQCLDDPVQAVMSINQLGTGRYFLTYCQTVFSDVGRGETMHKSKFLT